MSLSTVVEGLFKVIEFETIARLVTDNRQRDSLIQGLVLTILVIVRQYLITGLQWAKDQLVEKWTNRDKTVAKEVFENTITGIENCPKNMPHLMTITWFIADNFEFTARLVMYCFKYVKIFAGRTTLLYDNSTLRPFADNPWKQLCDICTDEEEGDGILIYYHAKCGPIRIARRNKSIGLLATGHQAFEYFYRYIMSLPLEVDLTKPIGDVEPPNKIAGSKQLWVHQGDWRHPINRDRDLDHYVSRHKDIIRQALQNFDRRKERFNGVGTNNLGFMLHGPPGCGKTMLMKAVAVELDRDIRVIDMSQIQTKSAFLKLFENGAYDKEVLVFDEFDCVSGILRRKSSEEKTAAQEQVNTIQELKKKKDGYLIQKAAAVTKEQIENIDRLLTQVREEMDEAKNQLTLETILTCLDGVTEHNRRVMIACTNHIELIDPSILRPGRFDICIKLDYFNNTEIHQLLTLIFAGEWQGRPRATPEEWKLLEQTVFVEGVFSPSFINNTVLCYGSLGQSVRALIERGQELRKDGKKIPI